MIRNNQFEVTILIDRERVDTVWKAMGNNALTDPQWQCLLENMDEMDADEWMDGYVDDILDNALNGQYEVEYE